MWSPAPASSVACMNVAPNSHLSARPPSAPRAPRVQWLLILGLGSLALLRPLVRIGEHLAGVDAGPIVPVVLTVVISAVWVLVVGFGSAPRPIVTLLLTGIAYAVLAIVLSGVLSPLIDGALSGPLANPIAIIPVLAVNAVWGLAAGALAMLVRRLRSGRASRPR